MRGACEHLCMTRKPALRVTTVWSTPAMRQWAALQNYPIATHLVDDGHRTENDDEHGRHGGGHGHGREGRECRHLFHMLSRDRRRGVPFRAQPIRTDDEYVNWRHHLRVRYDKINALIKVDVTTGDVMAPGHIEYRYPLIFEEGSVGFCPTCSRRCWRRSL